MTPAGRPSRGVGVPSVRDARPRGDHELTESQ